MVEHFEQVLKQRLRRPLPRGFILVSLHMCSALKLRQAALGQENKRDSSRTYIGIKVQIGKYITNHLHPGRTHFLGILSYP